MFDSDISLCYR